VSAPRRSPPRARPRPAPLAGGPVATPRGLALRALIEIGAGARANVLVPGLLARTALDRRDRNLVTEMVYGTCRMQRACDWLVDRHLRRTLEPEVRAALRLGAYQLGWMRIPRHAAVAATVDEVAGPARSLVNAVLRRLADDVERGPVRWPDPATALSYPDWIVTRLAADLGPERARSALETMNRAAQAHERPDGYVQDPASQMVAAHVGAGPGERIADVCAAPGGKATALAGGDRERPALVVALDIDPARSVVVGSNAARLGLPNVAAVVADGRRPPLRPAAWDRVLVDAPCSGLGVLRRRPDARWRVRAADVPRLAALQWELLVAAADLVAPGGRLVYSVCTLTAAETVAVDGRLAAERSDLRPEPPPGPPWAPTGRGALLLPQAADTDGMFVLTLRRAGGR